MGSLIMPLLLLFQHQGIQCIFWQQDFLWFCFLSHLKLVAFLNTVLAHFLQPWAVALSSCDPAILFSSEEQKAGNTNLVFHRSHRCCLTYSSTLVYSSLCCTQLTLLYTAHTAAKSESNLDLILIFLFFMETDCLLSILSLYNSMSTDKTNNL